MPVRGGEGEVMKYAENTSVAVDRSKAEIERILDRYGAQKFIYGRDESRSMIGFEARGRCVRFTLPLPDRNDPKFWKTETGRKRKYTSVIAEWEQACRQRWRALALVIKAKLEAVESGITSFEDEFLAHTILPGGNGQTVGQWIAPQLVEAYERGEMPRLLPLLGPAETVQDRA